MKKISMGHREDKVIPVDDGKSLEIPQPNNNQSAFHYGQCKIFFLGLVVGGQYSTWNGGLTAGLYSYLIAYCMMGLAYICFCMCMAEVTGALPFAGGSYGIARCTLGFFPAFMIGISEILEYIVSVAIAGYYIGLLSTQVLSSLAGCEPLIIAIAYLTTSGFHCLGGNHFWNTTLIVGLMTLVVAVIYCLGCLKYVDFKANALADSTQLYVGGISQFMNVLPFTAWSFLGIEALNFAINDVQSPTITIPNTQIYCIGTIFVVGLSVILTTVALPTSGIASLATQLTPLSAGFKMTLKVGPQAAAALILPGLYSTFYGLSWAYTKLILAMAKSQLLPSLLATTSNRFKTPHFAVLLGAVTGFTICVAVNQEPHLVEDLLPICLFFAFLSYSGQCIGYISLSLNYPLSRRSSYKNPFGVAGAVYSLLVWILGLVGILGFQQHDSDPFILVVIVYSSMGIYYWFYARHHQTMSEEESKILLVAHISRFNARKRASIKYKVSSKSKGTEKDVSGKSKRSSVIRL